MFSFEFKSHKFGCVTFKNTKNPTFNKGIKPRTPTHATKLTSKPPNFPPMEFIIAQVTINNKGAAIKIAV